MSTGSWVYLGKQVERKRACAKGFVRLSLEGEWNIQKSKRFYLAAAYLAHFKDEATA